MVLLHFRQIDEVDWCRELQCGEVELVLAPVVYRQLDRHKDGHRTPMLRERAKTTVAKLKALLGQASSASVRQGVVIAFEHRDPLVSFEEHQLSRESEDDQLIAGMIQCAHERSGESVLLVTDDFLLAQKARAAGFAVHTPAESNRLQDAPTEDQKRVRLLEEENRRLRERRPLLSVTFADGSQRLEVAMPPTPPWTDLYREQRMNAIRAKYPPLATETSDESTTSFQQALLRLSTGYVSTAQREAYNNELEAFYDTYRAHLDEEERHKTALARRIRVALELHNSGTAPARDIDLLLSVSVSVVGLSASSDKLKAPQPPEAPKPPKPFDPLALPEFGISARDLYLPHGPLIPSIPRPDNPVLRVRRHYEGPEIEVGLNKLKHGMVATLPKFTLIYQDEAAIQSFKMAYSINSDDLPEDETGELHFVINRGT